MAGHYVEAAVSLNWSYKMQDVTLRMIASEDCAEAEAVCGWLREFNLKENGHFMQLRELPEHAAHPLQLFAFREG